MATKGAAVTRRLRVSAWTDQTEFMTIDRKGNLKPGVKEDRESYFNPDALKNEVFAGQPGGFRVIDDISLLQTIIDDDTPGIGIRFDRRVLSFEKDAARERFFNKVIDYCHDVLGVQCLIGFERARMDPRPKPKPKPTNPDEPKPTKPEPPEKLEPSLSTWFKMQTPVPSIDDVTTRIVAFCDKHLPGFDGISFDLEGLSGPPSTLPLAIANMEAFYTSLARKLRKEPWPSGATRDRDRLVALASGNLIGRLPTRDGQNPDTMRSSRLLKHEPNGELARVGDDYVSASDPLKAAYMEQAQDYNLGRADQNLIIRPMAYDNFTRTDGPQVLDDWHADIVRYMRTIKLGGPPVKIGNETFSEPVETATFQLGLKTVPGPGQEDKLEKDGTISKGMDGVMGGFSGGDRDPGSKKLNPAVANSLSARINHVRARCTNLLNPNGIGVCFFPTSPSMWKDANEALNPTMPEAGVSLGHPKQAPLSLENLALLNKTKKPSRTP